MLTGEITKYTCSLGFWEKRPHTFSKIKIEVSSALATSFSQLKIRNYSIIDVPKLIHHSIAINILFCRKLLNKRIIYTTFSNDYTILPIIIHLPSIMNKNDWIKFRVKHTRLNFILQVKRDLEIVDVMSSNSNAIPEDLNSLINIPVGFLIMTISQRGQGLFYWICWWLIFNSHLYGSIASIFLYFIATYPAWGFSVNGLYVGPAVYRINSNENCQSCKRSFTWGRR